MELLINNFFLDILQGFAYFSGVRILRNKSEWLLLHFSHMLDAGGNIPFPNKAQTMFILHLFVSRLKNIFKI